MANDFFSSVLEVEAQTNLQPPKGSQRRFHSLFHNTEFLTVFHKDLISCGCGSQHIAFSVLLETVVIYSNQLQKPISCVFTIFLWSSMYIVSRATSLGR